MGRPKQALPDASAIEALIDERGQLRVRVTPGARVDDVSLFEGQLAVKTRAKPQDGAANEAVMAVVAKALGIAPSFVALLRGQTSREKVLRISR
ncbi:DUF167 domain-containing protein [Qipengyuania sp. 1NDH17]|uniref:UPF0235 protein K3152_10970 n=1 Tax=Qipengyuania polymorpha TaxID=2867234 RepID=A0ABS7J5R2_9SPHN|nr:DUF167 domain-containing protein [Qipengyuania polymorpha]MBX7458768.1 DUF167 domain-containing protein [Qipengyuania polymorpha]